MPCAMPARLGGFVNDPEIKKQTDRFLKSNQLGPLVIAFI